MIEETLVMLTQVILHGGLSNCKKKDHLSLASCFNTHLFIFTTLVWSKHNGVWAFVMEEFLN